MGLFRNFFKPKKGKGEERENKPQAGETAPPAAEKLSAFYTDEEREVVERYVADAFGPIGRTYYDVDGAGVRVDIAVAEPTAERRYYTLATIGMGAHRMNVPASLEERNAAFAELTVCLPPDWDLINDSWPFHMLKTTARFPFDRRDMLCVGNAYHGAITKGSGFAGAFVIPAATRGRMSTRLMLPGGRIVNYYQLLPIYEDEWDYIVSRRDSASFWERYSERIGSIVVDPERASCVDEAETEEGD